MQLSPDQGNQLTSGLCLRPNGGPGYALAPEANGANGATLPHLIHSRQLNRPWLEEELFPLCDSLRKGNGVERTLAGRALYCLFYEPSFLTRASFERAMSLLGGHVQFTEDATQFFPVRSATYIEDTIKFLASLRFHAAVVRSSQPGAVDAAAGINIVSVINGGSDVDHPTQALLDIYTLRRELGGVDGIKIAVVGRVAHRNVNALLTALALYRNVQVALVPCTGGANSEVLAYCREAGMKVTVESCLDSLAQELDAIYLNGAETAAHTQLIMDRNLAKVKVDRSLLQKLRPDCIILDPMQRSEPLITDNGDSRWAGYRQAENGLFVRMAVLLRLLDSSQRP
jgi:aspartate carbamoyltransferase catalytic subunit